MDPASLEFITWKTIQVVVETQFIFPVRLILVCIRKERTMNSADDNLGMDGLISLRDLLLSSSLSRTITVLICLMVAPAQASIRHRYREV